ncbi:MAG: OmpH family outer membrane protein [Planctomycetota bacterium]
MRTIERTLLIVLTIGFVAIGLRVFPSAETAIARPLMAQSDDRDIIAVCGISELMNEMLNSDRFAPEREEMEQKANAVLAEALREVQALRADLEGKDPSEPDVQQKLQQLQEMGRRIQAMRDEIAKRLDRFAAEQAVECRKLVIASAAAVAGDLGYRYVISSGARDATYNTEGGLVQVWRQMATRPVVAWPDATNITEDVREDLNLD